MGKLMLKYQDNLMLSKINFVKENLMIFDPSHMDNFISNQAPIKYWYPGKQCRLISHNNQRDYLC